MACQKALWGQVQRLTREQLANAIIALLQQLQQEVRAQSVQMCLTHHEKTHRFDALQALNTTVLGVKQGLCTENANDWP